MDAETAGQMRSLLQLEIDWTVLLAAARRHGLTPLLFWHLNSLCSRQVPKDVLLELRKRFTDNSARNLWLATELAGILTLFENHGIAAIPFKGAVLAASVYGNLAFREFLDLDILVAEQDIVGAQDLLHSQGFKPTLNIPPKRVLSFRRSEHEISYQQEDRILLVGLHWKFAPPLFPFAIDMENAWRRLEWIVLAGKRVRNLSPEDLLFALCAHGGQHLWGKLECICGVAELIRVHPRMDWTRILEQARASKSERVLLLGLRLAIDLLGATLPEEILEGIRADGALTRLVVDTRRRLFAPDRDPITASEYCLQYARQTDRFQDGIRILLRMALLPRFPDWAYLELPPCVSFLYYPVRVFRLLRNCLLAPPDE